MMIPRQKSLSRRTVLRGAGVALGLPWLEAMIPGTLAASSPADTKSPVRMAVLYMANGVNTSQWKPEGTGKDFRLSPTLQPLEDLGIVARSVPKPPRRHAGGVPAGVPVGTRSPQVHVPAEAIDRLAADAAIPGPGRVSRSR